MSMFIIICFLNVLIADNGKCRNNPQSDFTFPQFQFLVVVCEGFTTEPRARFYESNSAVQ